MIYVIDTGPWREDDVREQCAAHGIEFSGGFFFERTCTWLASLLVKKHIAAEAGVPFELQVTDRGKPRIPGVEFSITHHNRIVVAVSAAHPVGIDLTDKETPFTPGQQRELWVVKPNTCPSGVFWAAREAYLKYTGEGSREGPLEMKPPSHLALPDLEHWQWSVMPVMKVESVLARCFKVRGFVGVVVSRIEDVQEVSLFSSEPV